MIIFSGVRITVKFIHVRLDIYLFGSGGRGGVKEETVLKNSGYSKFIKIEIFA